MLDMMARYPVGLARLGVSYQGDSGYEGAIALPNHVPVLKAVDPAPAIGTGYLGRFPI